MSWHINSKTSSCHVVTPGWSHNTGRLENKHFWENEKEKPWKGKTSWVTEVKGTVPQHLVQLGTLNNCPKCFFRCPIILPLGWWCQRSSFNHSCNTSVSLKAYRLETNERHECKAASISVRLQEKQMHVVDTCFQPLPLTTCVRCVGSTKRWSTAVCLTNTRNWAVRPAKPSARKLTKTKRLYRKVTPRRLFGNSSTTLSLTKDRPALGAKCVGHH